tara:strand:+ start:318 stop:482 length:165 start_codon:yes stop_codon:yes gene_type:complete
MKPRYTIVYKDKVLFSDLGEIEYFERMEDLSIEFYQTGIPNPQEIITQIQKDEN